MDRDLDADKVAQITGVGVDQVYLIRHRLRQKFDKLVHSIENSGSY